MTYIFRDSKEDATGFETLLEELQAGDCVVVERLSSAAKDTGELLALLDRLEAREIRFRSMEESFDTGTQEGRFALDMMKKTAQLGAEKEKPAEHADKEDSHSKGRKPIEVDEEMFDSILERWKNGEITARQAMAELNLKPNTFYRRVKERAPEAKNADSLLDAAKKFGKEIVSTVTEGSEEFQQAAGKFAADHDMSAFSDTVKKNISAASAAFSRHMDSLSKDFQTAMEKLEKKQQEAAKSAGASVADAENVVDAVPEEPVPQPAAEEAAAPQAAEPQEAAQPVPEAEEAAQPTPEAAEPAEAAEAAPEAEESTEAAEAAEPAPNETEYL